MPKLSVEEAFEALLGKVIPEECPICGSIVGGCDCYLDPGEVQGGEADEES